MPKPRKWKRKGPKSTRAGCLLCKPHKANESKDTRDSLSRRDLRQRASASEQTDALRSSD